ncbi:MAG: hypothetical protein HY581_02670 [Nitrospirae bacterium]|nr:hypothetical protein [Nitrospirota bacterium]
MKIRRPILVISRNERAGKWFRFMLGGRRTGLPTTVTTDLEEGIRALKRLHPRVVIFVDEGLGKTDDRLMLLEALLLIEKQSQQNTLALLYDLTDGRLTMYHNVHLPRVSPEDVAHAATETVSCPLFGYAEEAAPGFPKDCHFLPLMVRGAAHAAGAAPSPTRD